MLTQAPGSPLTNRYISAKIRKDLGWEPKIDFERGISRTVRWYLDNPGWCEEMAGKGYHGERLGLALQKEGR